MVAESKQNTGTRTITAAEFKTKCLQLLDEVAESGEAVVITKNGRPVSRLAPYREAPKLVFGRNRENIRILGDIVSPMPTEWYEDPEEADKDLF